MQVVVKNAQTCFLIEQVLRKLSVEERELVEHRIKAITDCDLVTAVRPFMFGGKVIHELYFDPSKLAFFADQEKIGAVLSAFIIASLAERGLLKLSDQELRTHPDLIAREARSLKHANEVSAFLSKFAHLEDEWRSTVPEE